MNYLLNPALSIHAPGKIRKMAQTPRLHEMKNKKKVCSQNATRNIKINTNEELFGPKVSEKYLNGLEHSE